MRSACEPVGSAGAPPGVRRPPDHDHGVGGGGGGAPPGRRRTCALPDRPSGSVYEATNTALRFAAPAWPESRNVVIEPVQPAVEVGGWPCVSWPDVRHGDLGAVHWGVVGDGDRVGHGVTEVERAARGRQRELHHRLLVADEDPHIGRGRAPVRYVTRNVALNTRFVGRCASGWPPWSPPSRPRRSPTRTPGGLRRRRRARARERDRHGAGPALDVPRP